ncbi:hypothetical protein Rhe02_63000 [Rhizocola hellebori]|uniref:DUF6817 domain-containing protein n=1 Tax=Rhizocola hellebori TaxID=1392758 RepID=A0A8J3VJQ8_9ACTN|nr:hypothetical protein Rhe02_63000 [Rhizocola hellebori]
MSATLARWQADPAIQAAGLCHACYGTDGFDVSLMRLDERPVLGALIGQPAEELVYLYGSCDRAAVYPQFRSDGPVIFRDRFTGETHCPSEKDCRAFMELTAANELDVLARDSALAAKHSAGLFRLFKQARGYLSDAAWQACEEQLGSAPWER